ncbi:hypothetical protein GQ55_3G456900 [Panicum hallii var. hallii]|uniref:Uncharacterized protein n=1 Tax=Panicum hallii var. hallii TaxID=1504633 RepID=A0A2T7EIR3_9POAL|nr:hypothetical protein GQ55_3G456900 [Panicum hallii var. hallii]
MSPPLTEQLRATAPPASSVSIHSLWPLVHANPTSPLPGPPRATHPSPSRPQPQPLQSGLLLPPPTPSLRKPKTHGALAWPGPRPDGPRGGPARAAAGRAAAVAGGGPRGAAGGAGPPRPLPRRRARGRARRRRAQRRRRGSGGAHAMARHDRPRGRRRGRARRLALGGPRGRRRRARRRHRPHAQGACAEEAAAGLQGMGFQGEEESARVIGSSG